MKKGWLKSHPFFMQSDFVAEYLKMLSHFFCSYNKLIFCHEVNEIPCNVYFVA